MPASLTKSKTAKVLMTADAVGGVWQYAVDLLSGFAGQGFEFLLATLGPRPSEQQRQQLATLPHVSLLESDFALEWMPSGECDFDPCGSWLLHLETAFQPDLIHLNGYSHAALPWQVPVLVVAHSCVFSWWRAVHAAPPPESSWNAYFELVSKGLKRASRIIAPSHSMASCLTAEYPAIHEKPQVIPNFGNLAPHMPAGAGKQPFSLAAGRLWDKAKNVSLLQAIAPHVDWPIRLAGDAIDPENSLSLEFLGNLPHDELLDQMRAASLFLHPALYEPFGLSVLEAARCGCCLVLADIPSLRELWNGAAVFVPPRDANAWIASIQLLTRDASRRRKLAGRAQAHSLRYCHEATLTAYQDLYAGLLGQRRRSAQSADGAAA